MFVDADAHVHECEETWSYLPSGCADLAPRTVSFESEEVPEWLKGKDGLAGRHRFWFIDGKLFARHVTSDEKTGTTMETRNLRDIPGRLRHMDELGVETQVIYPSVLLSEVTRRPDVEVALYKSYNRWLADGCAESGGRLAWIAMIPFSSMTDALEEMRFAKDHGACGVFKRGIEWNRAASDPHFFPAYDLAQDLDLPICIHKAFRWSPTSRGIPRVRPPEFNEYDELSAFAALVAEEIPTRFERLRIGFIESGSSWLPHLLGSDGGLKRHQTLEDLRFFVACDLDEDISYLIDLVGDDDHLFVYTDYGHGGGDREAHRMMLERTEFDETSRAKMTSDNARRFYGL